MDGADTQSLAIAAPVMARELGIAPARLGAVFSIGVLGGAIGAMLCGPLADRWGPKRMLALCTLGFGLFQLGTNFVTGVPSLLLVRALAGIGLGGAAPCFLALAAAHAPAEHRARILSLLWACFPLGALAGGIANGWIVQHLGWREVFLVGGIAPVAFALIVMTVAPEAPAALAHGRQRPVLPGGRRPRPLWWTDVALRHRIVLLWGILFAAFGALGGIVVWMPSILVRSGLQPEQGGLVLSWHALGALVSMASAGYLVERLGAWLLAAGLLLGAIALLFAALVLPAFGPTAALMVVLGVLFGISASGAIAIAGALLPSAARSSGLGWSMGIGRLGQVVLPFLMGLGLERTSPAWVLAALALCPALLTIAAVRFVVLSAQAAQSPDAEVQRAG